jgi:hypothetical protein
MASAFITISGGSVIAPLQGLDYQGTWNATTNTPALADGAGTAGDFYYVSVAGTQDLGSGNIAFDVGDKAIYNGSVWEKLSFDEKVSKSGDTMSGDLNVDTNVKVGDGSAASYVPDGNTLTVTTAADEGAIFLRVEGSSETVETELAAWGGAGETYAYFGTITNHASAFMSNFISRLLMKANGQTVVAVDVVSGGSPAADTNAVFSVVADSNDSLDAFKIVDEASSDLLVIDKNGQIGYTPTTAADWNGAAPTTITEALDRCATLLKTLNGGVGP